MILKINLILSKDHNETNKNINIKKQKFKVK